MSKVSKLITLEEVANLLIDNVEDTLGELIDNTIDDKLDELRVDNQVEEELNEHDEDYLIELRDKMIEKIKAAITTIK